MHTTHPPPSVKYQSPKTAQRPEVQGLQRFNRTERYYFVTAKASAFQRFTVTCPASWETFLRYPVQMVSRASYLHLTLQHSVEPIVRVTQGLLFRGLGDPNFDHPHALEKRGISLGSK